MSKSLRGEWGFNKTGRGKRGQCTCKKKAIEVITDSKEHGEPGPGLGAMAVQ